MGEFFRPTDRGERAERIIHWFIGKFQIHLSFLPFSLLDQTDIFRINAENSLGILYICCH